MNIKFQYMFITGLLVTGFVSDHAFAAQVNCSNTDVTLNGLIADECVGPNSGNINAASDLSGVFNGGWSNFLKSDGPTSGNYDFGGTTFTFSLSATGAKSGDFNINVTPGASALFPLNLDLVVGMFAGNNWDAYLFDDRDVSPSNNGIWAITFQNNGGRIPDLSHLFVAFRDGTGSSQGCVIGSTDPQCITVPEPGNLSLLGIGLLGMVAALRRVKD